MIKFIKKYKYIFILFLLIVLLIYTNKYKNNVIASLKNTIYKIQDYVTPNIKYNENIIKIINRDRQEEIKKLNNILKLNEYINYEIIYSKILSKNKDIFSDLLIITKGQKDSIIKGMPVITDKGLIGIVDDVYENYSSILLLNNKKKLKNLSIKIINNNKEINGIIKDYNYKSNSLIIETIRNNEDINKGNKVFTNGYNQYIPSGIPIGTINKIKTKKDKYNQIIEVKLYENLDNIKYVGIIKGIIK